MKRRRFDDTDETLDIPDFIEDKTITDSSTSVDMSIFKMSDDELYDDAETAEDEEDEEDDDFDDLRPKKKRKGNTPLIICLIVIALLLAACAGSLFYALKQHQSLVKTKTEYLQLQANEENYKRQLQEKDDTINNLTKQIEELKNANNKGTGSLIYEIVDGGMYFRNEPTSDADKTTFNGAEQCLTGEKYNVIEVVDDKDVAGIKWAKLADNVYFCLGTAEETWAKQVQ
jgi:hypothetical protein